MINYTPKYYVVAATGAPGLRGRPSDPSQWITGPDPIAHDIYYGWLKHRSQARYRGETYTITAEQWHQLWDRRSWLNRGRKSHNQMLVRINNEAEWSINNVKIVLVKDKGQYYTEAHRCSMADNARNMRK